MPQPHKEKKAAPAQKKAKQGTFLLILVLIALALIAVIVSASAIGEGMPVIGENLIWIILLIIFLLLVWKFDFLLMLKDYERAVIYRFGRVNRVGGPGWAVVFPPIEEYMRVDLRTHTIDVPPQAVVTKDNIELKIDAVIYLRVMKDPQSVIRSVIEVEDYEKAARLFVVAQIRDIIGSMVLSEVISNIEILNRKIKEGLVHISKDWGVECEAVEITDVKIPRPVVEAMHRGKAAEQDKLARFELAEAHRAEIDAVNRAAEQLSDRALSYHYIRALEKMAEGRATKIIFPVELSRMAEMLGGKLGAPKGAPAEQLIQQYAPLLLEYIRKEKEARDAEKPKQGGGNKR